MSLKEKGRRLLVSHKLDVLQLDIVQKALQDEDI